MTEPTTAQKILAPYTRLTSSGRYLPEVDGLRCLAIVLVILFHGHHLFRTGQEPVTAAALSETDWPSIFNYLPNFFIAKGYFGVQIFFVISGMVLALPFASHFLQGQEKPALRDYFKRRLVRIEIPYLITLTFFLLWGLAFQGDKFTETLPHYLAGLIYSHSLIYDGALNPILTVAWTLELEIQFYLLAPLLCRIFALKNTTLRRTLLLLTITFIDPAVSKANELLPSVIWRESILDQLSYFIGGLLLADLLLSPKIKTLRSRQSGIIWDLTGLLAWPSVFLLIEVSTPVNLKPFVLILAFLATLIGPRLRRAFSNRWITAIGMMCYTIYLFHSFFIYSIINPLFFKFILPITPGDWPLNHLLMAILLLFCIILSALVFLLVEKPFARGKLPQLLQKNRE